MKKLLVVLLTIVMLTGLVACSSEKETSKKGADTGTEKEADTSSNTKKDSETSDAKEEIVNIKWVQIGSGMPTNYDAWKANVDEYLAEKIGVNLDIEVISWGDWDARRSVIVNTNEPFDILFTNANTFVNDVTIGAYLDISQLVKEETPELYNMMPQGLWDAASVNGKVYAVPTYKDSSMTNYWIWDKAIVDKYNVDIENNTTYASLTDKLVEIKEGENEVPFYLSSDAPGVGGYDNIGSGLSVMGVDYKDESRKVVSIFEQEDAINHLKVLHDWYNKGIINSDAATLAEKPTDRILGLGQGWSTAAITVWGPQQGKEVVAIQYDETILSNNTVRGSLNAISANSKHPEKALQLLQLANTDSKFRDMLYYGLEGDNFDYTDKGKIHKNNQEWTMAGYSQATFFNVTQTDEVEINQWDEVKQLNENATPSVMLGFTMDTTPVEDEIANCNVIWTKYRLQLLTGTSEPESTVAAMMKELRAAGFDKILAEAQKQVDAQY